MKKNSSHIDKESMVLYKYLHDTTLLFVSTALCLPRLRQPLRKKTWAWQNHKPKFKVLTCPRYVTVYTILNLTRKEWACSSQFVPSMTKRPICAVERTCLPTQGQTS